MVLGITKIISLLAMKSVKSDRRIERKKQSSILFPQRSPYLSDLDLGYLTLLSLAYYKGAIDITIKPLSVTELPDTRMTMT